MPWSSRRPALAPRTSSPASSILPAAEALRASKTARDAWRDASRDGCPAMMEGGGRGVAVRSAAAAGGLVVRSVLPGSAAAKLGLHAGDRLLAIDGLAPRDVIDLQLELPEAQCVTVERADGSRAQLRPEAQLDAAGLTLVEAIPGGI